MAAPQIPPRPVRAHHQQQPGQKAGERVMEAPSIPPRPAHRALERSRSPNRDHFPKSPLNEVPFARNLGAKSGSSSRDGPTDSNVDKDLPRRPPSVSLPSIGQEGNEYADIVYEKPPATVADENPSQSEPELMRNVGSDLPLHAPRPSFSDSAAKARVSTVTRTDSVQAAAAGIGKAGTPNSNDDRNPQNRSLRPRISFSTTDSSASTEHPASAQAGDSDHGIPEIGQRVPMYPDAGDVQAPSPSPFSPNCPSGTNLPAEGTQKPGRHHTRTRSGRETFRGPPGSYGMHGHGVTHNDQFEKAWYDKHPDALVREEGGQYGPGIGGGRGEWALSSEDLNKLVRETARRGSGFGTSAKVEGLPNEQIGYLASEEYASRLNSPSSVTYHHKAHSNHSQSHVESPLRKASFPVDVDSKAVFERSKEPQGSARSHSESALESETEDDEIHVDAPAIRTSKYTGNGYDPPTEDLGPHGGNTDAEGGWIQETGYGVPILASDEVAKEPGSEYLQPAVSPVQERRGSAHYAGIDSDAAPSYQSGYRNRSRSGSAPNSRPSSRPGSIHGPIPGLTRFAAHDEREDMHTPLENVDEYEPLFPDEENKEGRPISAIEKFKRDSMKRRFPSQDIWEDTPNSLQLQATVETPEPVEEPNGSKEVTSSGFELPEAESARKGEVGEDEKVKLIPKEERLAKSNFKPHLLEERPGMKQRFPSSDIWEDSPDSARLETTVDEPQGDDIKSPVDEGLEAGAVVYTAGRPDDKTKGQIPVGQGAATAKPSLPERLIKTKDVKDSSDLGNRSVPSVPTRPQKRLHQVPPASGLSKESSPVEPKQVSPTESRKGPTLPDRPKPPVPARPARSVARDNAEMSPLSKSTSATSTGSGESQAETNEMLSPPAVPKSKPAIPSRPVGGKIASLKAGFLSDLDKRLQLGPQGPKPSENTNTVAEEVEDEKAPLADARKGRARGPARRKPATASVTSEADESIAKAKWSIQAWPVWSTDDNGSITIPTTDPSSASTSESRALNTQIPDSNPEPSAPLDPPFADDGKPSAAIPSAEPFPANPPPLSSDPAPPSTADDAAIQTPGPTELSHLHPSGAS